MSRIRQQTASEANAAARQLVQQPRIAVTRDRLAGLARDAYFIGRGRPDVDFERWLGGRLADLEREDGV